MLMQLLFLVALTALRECRWDVEVERPTYAHDRSSPFLPGTVHL
jgi:hypothetical protein